MTDWDIKKNSSEERVNEFLEKAKSANMTDAFLIASLTDEYIVDCWPPKKHTLNGKENKILEIRIFNPKQERKLFRGDIGSEFQERFQDDDSPKAGYEDYYDELQLLDIDEKRSEQLFKETGKEAGRVMTMGGGSYYLPLKSMKGARIQIRYYLSEYKDSGQARIHDWRLIRFTNDRELRGSEHDRK